MLLIIPRAIIINNNNCNNMNNDNINNIKNDNNNYGY